jgi:hypothetical protein
MRITSQKKNRVSQAPLLKPRPVATTVLTQRRQATATSAARGLIAQQFTAPLESRGDSVY